MSVLVVSGTGTGVGKTIVTAAVTALAMAQGQRVCVVKPAQTGVGPNDPGDLAEITALTGCTDTHEFYRYPDPLAPEAAARHAGLPYPDRNQIVARIGELASTRDLVLVEGAGGLLVRFDDIGFTLADVASDLDAPVVVVADPALGTLNHTALTLEALQRRGVSCAGVVLGSWPRQPDLACLSNLVDLPRIIGAPLRGAISESAGTLDVDTFRREAEAGLDPGLGGRFNGNDQLHTQPGDAQSPDIEDGT